MLNGVKYFVITLQVHIGDIINLIDLTDSINVIIHI